MPKHQKPIAPTRVMHEDDPVLVHHQTKWFTRINFTRLRGALMTVTFILLILVLVQVINAIDQINKERRDRINQTNEKICSLVDAVPSGNPRIDKVRADTTCGPYVAPPAANPSSFPTIPGIATTVPSSSRSSAHSGTGTATITVHAGPTPAPTAASTPAPVVPPVTTPAVPGHPVSSLVCNLPILSLC